MKPVIEILEEKISTAMAAVTGQKDASGIVGPATDPKFGDYQANGVMALAKKLKVNPRKLAEQIVAKVDVSDICEPPEVAGPGFINLKLKAAFVSDNLLSINKDIANLGIEKTTEPKTIVVDFSAPNIAKEMHVGHLRSTIIGDCICRLLEFLGHKVIRQNHIGDWGLPIGMLIATEQDLRDKGVLERVPPHQSVEGGRVISFPAYDIVPISEIEKMYRDANKRYDTDPQFAERARQLTYDLQNDDPEAIWYWKRYCFWNLSNCYSLYKELNVNLTPDDKRGESFYKDMLQDVVDELKRKNLAVESEGAICVFPPGFKSKEDKPLPFMIQKSDGAYLYATTDLAALRYRINKLKSNTVIYVTDSRQKLHFEMLFAVADMAGWNKRNGNKVDLVHVTFGSVLGENGQPLKTREGENVKLKELLDEAVERARKIVEEKRPDLCSDDEEKIAEKEKIAKAVGIGAVKYADFSNNRTSDYVFSFDKMLAMDGNTAPYMQYAYARISSIMKKGRDRGISTNKEISDITTLYLTESAELDLAKHLIRYGEVVQSAAADYRPNYLTTYLYELAQKFSVFYTNCPVLDAGPNKRPTRLLLCDLTARTIKHGLSNLLGIELVEQM